MKSAYYLVSAASMPLGVPVMIVALFVKGRFMIPAIAVAAFFLLFNTAPLNAAVINSVGAHIRATALAVNIFIIHILGDVPSPTMMGWVADKRSLQAAFILPVIAMVVSSAILFYGMKFAPRSRDGAPVRQGRPRRDGIFSLDCGNDSGAGLVLPHRGCRSRHAQRRRCFTFGVGSRSGCAAGNPRVSIIVPARNEEATIEQALNTLLALDYDNYEVIAVNDRSTDRTGEIMERVASYGQNPMSRKSCEMGHPSAACDSSHGTACGMAGEDACHVDGGESGYRRLAALHRC